MQSCSKSLKFSIYSFDTILWNLENSPVLPYFLSRAVATTATKSWADFFPIWHPFLPSTVQAGTVSFFACCWSPLAILLLKYADFLQVANFIATYDD